ncbi:MAG: hypothetical protein F6K17_25650 [Okeania sp. SIO3C4]|nr:hypothetical protein [Okeania sp. SIO3C4]
MIQASVEKNTAIKRISEMIDKIMEKEKIYQKLDRNELIETFSKLLDKIYPQEINSLDNRELTKRIEGVIIVDAMSHLLDDFMPEKIEFFEAELAGK